MLSFIGWSAVHYIVAISIGFKYLTVLNAFIPQVYTIKVHATNKYTKGDDHISCSVHNIVLMRWKRHFHDVSGQ